MSDDKAPAKVCSWSERQGYAKGIHAALIEVKNEHERLVEMRGRDSKTAGCLIALHRLQDLWQGVCSYEGKAGGG